MDKRKLVNMRIFLIVSALMVCQILSAQNAEERKSRVCGFCFDVYGKEEIVSLYENQYKQFLGTKNYSLAIDLRAKKHLIITEIDDRILCVPKQIERDLAGSSKIDSDTVFIYPEISDSSLYKKCGFELTYMREMAYIKNCAFRLSPYYESSDNNMLFKCFYFEGTALIRNINEMDYKWAAMLIDSYAIEGLRNQKLVLIIDRIQTYTPYKLLGYYPVWLPCLR